MPIHQFYNINEADIAMYLYDCTFNTLLGWFSQVISLAGLFTNILSLVIIVNYENKIHNGNIYTSVHTTVPCISLLRIVDSSFTSVNFVPPTTYLAVFLNSCFTLMRTKAIVGI